MSDSFFFLSLQNECSQYLYVQIYGNDTRTNNKKLLIV